MTHDYRRNGTVDLFAALNVATGEVLHQTRKRHTGRDVLAFFKWIDLHTPRHLDVHVVLDNLSAHKSQPVRDWLAHPKRRRWHLHFTPTSASWLNLVEAWFSVLTRKALTNNSFNSTATSPTPSTSGPRTGTTTPALRLDPTRQRHHRQSQTRTSRPHQNRDRPLERTDNRPAFS